jgi:hypothetical protein
MCVCAWPRKAPTLAELGRATPVSAMKEDRPGQPGPPAKWLEAGLDPQRLKPDAISELTVRLKAYPDTNRDFRSPLTLIRSDAGIAVL